MASADVVDVVDVPASVVDENGIFLFKNEFWTVEVFPTFFLIIQCFKCLACCCVLAVYVPLKLSRHPGIFQHERCEIDMQNTYLSLYRINVGDRLPLTTLRLTALA